jgi:hypothetical protein
MTVEYLQVPIGDHGQVKIQIEPTRREDLSNDLGVGQEQPAVGQGLQELGSEREVQALSQTGLAIAASAFDQVSDTVYAFAWGFRDTMSRIDPQEASLEFGIVISGEAGVVVKAGGEATLKVTLTWKALAE